ncbi:hypothetical protein A0H81_02421 [Grifola frondosa]|uniref:Oxidoreductase YusZ n=1 Tax=Grifola frondosa TaxID=5627 RepID=A0A1C7MM26_GRIFR|nr:hypothetical protein A0H81_02421 [Grifola frondosa]
MSTPKVWLITGASSGFGRAMTELVLKKGDIVIATLRRPEVLADLSSQYSADRLLRIKLDVSKEQDIVNAFMKVKGTFGRLDIVFSNAGFSVLSEAEDAPEDAVRSMFEVNFWGAARVQREAVKFLRTVNPPGVGGRILQNSSMLGISGIPVYSYYCASKFAIEGFTESLAQEVDPVWNIKITLVEPGGFQTDAHANRVATPIHPAYSSPTSPAAQTRKFIGGNPLPGDPKKAAEVLYKLAAFPDPPFHFPVGKDFIRASRKKVANYLADVDKFESWSEGIEVDSDT